MNAKSRAVSGATVAGGNRLGIDKGKKKIACEFKASTAPQITRGFRNVLDDLKISEGWIIGLVKEAYPIKKNVTTAPIDIFLEHIRIKEREMN